MAKKKSGTLLTGDARLRTVAEGEQVVVHGILWVFDELVENEIITCGTARDKLKELVALNCRLPEEECRKRVAAWKKKM